MIRSRVLTLAIAAAGAALFAALGLPLPLLLGPLAACLLAALAGARMQDMGRFGTLMRTILGVTIGASITPDLLGRLPGMGLSVAMVPVFIALSAALGIPFFRRVCGFDPVTSYYAAMPGGLQDMVLFGAEAGGDVRALSLIHATRVLVIVSLAPILITGIWGTPLDRPPGQPAADLPLDEMGLMILSGVLGWKIAARVRLFGASILGPLILTAILSLGGLIQHRPPAEAILAAQFFIGLAVGVKYVGITWRELRIDVLAGIGYCAILAVVSVFFAEAVALGGLAPQMDAFLAFAPGGQAEMAIIAILAGADLAFVVTHHLVRIMVVILCAPLVPILIRRWKKDTPP